jgi:hypothetical protein
VERSAISPAVRARRFGGDRSFLQTQFALLLYDMRFDLAQQANLDVERVEELLAARDVTGSSRFNDLLEQTQLLA